MKFNEGDYIVMKRGAPYNTTRYESTGFVKEVSEDQILVEFDYLTGDTARSSDTVFWVDKVYCKVTKPTSPQERVCAKIKQMEARWKKFQEGKCYV